jgi:hypothetical protein
MIGPHCASPVRGLHRILPKMAYRGQGGSAAYFEYGCGLISPISRISADPIEYGTGPRPLSLAT